MISEDYKDYEGYRGLQRLTGRFTVDSKVYSRITWFTAGLRGLHEIVKFLNFIKIAGRITQRIMRVPRIMRFTSIPIALNYKISISSTPHSVSK